MRRSLAFTDQLITFVVAVAILAVSVFTFLWWGGWLPSQVPQQFTLHWTNGIEDQPWYPWSLGGGGIAFCLLGGRLLLAHLRQHRVHKLRLPSPGADTSLHVDINAALDAACQSFEKSIDIKSASATAVREGGGLVCSFVLKIDAEADLGAIGAESDRVIGELKQCIGKDDLVTRVTIASASSKSLLGVT